MPYHLRYDQLGYVEMLHEGVIAEGDVFPIVRDVMTVVKENNTFLFLGDYRKTDLQISIGLLYEVPKHVYLESQRLGLQLGRFKRALVVSERLFEKFKFFETVSLNRMQLVKIFIDENEARGWLLNI